MPKFSKRLRALVVLALLHTAQNSYGFKVSPMIVSFDPQGPGATKSVQIENPGDSMVTIELTAFSRAHEESGKEVRKDTEDFTIYPEQLSLKPKEKRSIRMTYIGNSALTEEKPYRLVITQLPVTPTKPTDDSGKAKVNLEFLLEYVVSAYVKPSGTSANVVVESIKHSQEKNSKSIELVLKNAGNAHQVLTGSQLSISSEGTGKEVTWTLPEELRKKTFDSENLLPGAKRRWLLTAPANINLGSKLKADFTLKLNE